MTADGHTGAAARGDDPTEGARVEAFTRRCRAAFADTAWALGVTEVQARSHPHDPNPFFLRYEDAALWYALEGVHWGFGLALTFGRRGQGEAFSVVNGLWLLEGADAAQAHAARYQTPGYVRALEGHIAALERHPWFFEGRGWLDHIAGLVWAQAEATRAAARQLKRGALA